MASHRTIYRVSASATRTVRERFECERCNWRGFAVVTARGQYVDDSEHRGIFAMGDGAAEFARAAASASRCCS